MICGFEKCTMGMKICDIGRIKLKIKGQARLNLPCKVNYFVYKKKTINTVVITLYFYSF